MVFFQHFPQPLGLNCEIPIAYAKMSRFFVPFGWLLHLDIFFTILVFRVISECSLHDRTYKRSLHSELFAGLCHGKVLVYMSFFGLAIGKVGGSMGHHPRKTRRI